MANWIKSAIKHPGALHRALGVKKGKKIPKSMLKKHEHDKGKMGKRVRLAESLAKMRRKSY